MILQELQVSCFSLCWVSQRFHPCPAAERGFLFINQCFSSDYLLLKHRLFFSLCETSQYLFHEITITLSHYPKFTWTTVNSLEVKYLPVRDFFHISSPNKGKRAICLEFSESLFTSHWQNTIVNFAFS